MKTPILIATLKILASGLALLMAASAKWLKDRNKRMTRREAMNQELKIFPRNKRLMYDGDDFMEKHYPQKVFFWDEIIINAFRPLMILVVLSIFSYNSYWFKFFLAFIVLSFAFIEWSIEEIKDKNWYKFLLCLIWICTFLIIYYEEWLLQNSL